MRVDFDYLKFKNIGSWGNELTTIDFNKGVSLISAPNGSGKSYIIEALVFCLTGKPYRKLKKIKNIINRKNKKNLFTEVGFHIGKKYWKVTRTLSPDTLTYSLKQSNGEYKDIDSLSSKSLDQAEIEKILKIDPFMIKQIVALDVNYNKPFLSLTAAESRAILEAVFNLTIFSRMLSELKTLLAGYEADLKLDEKSLLYLNKNIDTQLSNINSMEEMLNSYNIIKQQSIEKINKQIDDLNNELKQCEDNIKEAEEYLKNTTIKPIESKISTIKSIELRISDLRYSKKEKLERINLLNKGKCPTCKTDFHGSKTLETELVNLKNDIHIIDNEIEQSLLTLSNNENELNDLNDNNNEIRELNNAIEYEKNSVKSFKTKIDNLEKEIIIEQNKQITFDINIVKKQLENSIKEKEELESRINDLTNHITNMKDAKSVLSDKGAKAYLMKRFIPLLNSKVQNYIEKFELNVIIKFDEMMEVNIYDPKSINEPLEYESFSKGEKKRLDMAILFSFMGVTKEICNWHCNIMFLDELLDGGLDDNGLDKVGRTIKNMVDEDNLCVYTISQRKLSYNLFNNYLFIEKDNYGFSSITHTKEI